jgi:predicted unusual protein kinase regulating ubiquinone biosynthesis (AarF/ABC1/UbiB family)
VTGPILPGVAAGLLLASLVLPTSRRLWTFVFYAAKHLLVARVADKLGLRRLWARVAGRACEPLTGPSVARRLCEDLGPVFIKFGQLVASSTGMFPERYCLEFRKCLDHVRPVSFTRISRTLRQELGPKRFAALANVSAAPLASASIAQVHSATLADGTDVVVKVQRPGLDRRVRADLRIFKAVARLAQRYVRHADLANPVGVLEDFHQTLQEELDFQREAENLDTFNRIQRELGVTDVRAPVPHWNLTTRRVLVMERFRGTRIDDVPQVPEIEVDAEGKLISGMMAWFRCVLFYGFFHGDVHAGNLMLLDDNAVGFLDFGIVGRFSERQRLLVTDYLIAFTTGDYSTLGKVIAEMGGVDPNTDFDAFARDLERTYRPLLSMQMGNFNVSELISRLHQTAVRHHMILPREFVLITKQMLYFDRYAKILAPTLNIFSDPRLVFGLMSDIKKSRDASRNLTGPAAAPPAGAA